MASQLELFALGSPCIGVCQTDARGYCLGCHRSRDERFRWLEMSDEQKREVLRLCRARARRKTQQSCPTVPHPEQLSLFEPEPEYKEGAD
ncbi:MAG: DUF1289 domain-containing protein [Aeromonadaceae bacterium]